MTMPVEPRNFTTRQTRTAGNSRRVKNKVQDLLDSYRNDITPITLQKLREQGEQEDVLASSEPLVLTRTMARNARLQQVYSKDQSAIFKSQESQKYRTVHRLRHQQPHQRDSTMNHRSQRDQIRYTYVFRPLRIEGDKEVDSTQPDLTEEQ